MKKRVFFTLDLKPLSFKEKLRLMFHRTIYILKLHYHGIYKKLEWIVVNDAQVYETKRLS